MPIVQVLKNFLGSEKGILALALIIGATVLTALGKMSLAEWQEYTIWIFGIYTGGKAVQGAASAIRDGLKRPALPEPAAEDDEEEEGDG
jgi:hypothetical protein